jgi:hypothetical protein
MRFSSNRATTIAVVFAATMTMIVLPSLVESFQQPIQRQQRSLLKSTGPLWVSSPPEQSEAAPAEPLSLPDPEGEQEVKIPLASAAVVVSPPETTKTTSTTGAVAIAEARTMDEGIYGFNKKLIDTVYDVICFLYPVKGDERDFARFYVLETVARVPYFAYLSVMHLRETFGERYDSMSERCVQTN